MYTKDQIIEKLTVDQKWLERGLLAIYRYQTYEEQRSNDTRVKNSVGFSGAHARVCSYYAKWISKGNHLSGKHLEKAKKIMVHYAGQLTKIANKEI